MPATYVIMDIVFEHALRLDGGQGRKTQRQAVSHRKMLVIYFIGPIAAPNREAMLGKDINNRFSHSQLRI